MFELVESGEDDAEFVQLYAKMAQTLGVSGVVGQNPSALLSIQLPGVVVEPGLDPNDPETQYYISNFLNVALECNYVAIHKAGLTSDIYKLILDGKETPLIDLSQHEKARLQAAQDYLFDADGSFSEAYRSYMDHARAFYAAQDMLFACEATFENGGPDIPETVRERLSEARADWRTKGHRAEVNEALAVIRQLQARDPYVYWQALADRFAESTGKLKNGSEFQRVDCLPKYEDWFKGEEWTPFSFDEKDYKRQRRSGGTGMQGRECCCGLLGSRGMLSERGVMDDGTGRLDLKAVLAERSWRDQSQMLAAHGSGAPAEELGPMVGVASGQMKLTCSIRRIVILRPWMDASVFSSRMWKWSPQSIGRGVVISSGGSVAGNRTATGVLPVLPTNALLAKDITLTMSSEDTMRWIAGRHNAGQKVRYGPFVLDRITDSRVATVFGNEAAAVAIASGAPQMFGYISTIFGKCPNPDLTLPWPS